MGHPQMSLGPLFLAPCVSQASDTSDKAAQHPPAHAPASATAAGSRARQRGLRATYPSSVCTSKRVQRCPEGETSPLLSLWGKPVVGTAAGRQVSVPPRVAALHEEVAAAQEKCPSWETLPEKSLRRSSGSGAVG